MDFLAGPVVDRAQRLFVKAEDDLLLSSSVSDGAFRTFLTLRRHAIGGDAVFPSVTRLSALRAKSIATIERHLKELRDVGLIERDQAGNGRAATTFLNDPEALDLDVVEWSLKNEGSDGAAPSKMRDAAPSKMRGPKKERKGKEISAAAGAKTRAKPTTRPAGERSDHAEFVEWLCEDFLPGQGITYGFEGGKDAALVRRLLDVHGLDRLKRMVVASMSDEWLRDVGWSIGVFSKKANQISARLAEPSGDRPRKTSTRRRKKIDFTAECEHHGPDDECDVCVAAWRAYRRERAS